MDQLAEKLYAADRAVLVLEDQLMDLIQTTEVCDKWDDWSRDFYDYSLELYGVQPDARLSAESQAKFEEWGFSIVWLNHSDGWETTYSLHRKLEYRKERGDRGHKDSGNRMLRSEIKRLREQLSEAKTAGDAL